MIDLTTMPCRSVLYAPADKARVIAKAETLDADCVIFDLEDAVAPDNKELARETLRDHFRITTRSARYRMIRINALDTPWGTEDLMAARACMPDAILIPKVSVTSDVTDVFSALAETDAPDTLRIWAMVETARGVANIADIAQRVGNSCTRLDGLVIGTNDLFKETGLNGPNARQLAQPWLMQIVLAAKAAGLKVIDGVFNDYADINGFNDHCAQGSAMGMDGTSIIHPNQIEAANRAYSPGKEEIERARQIVDAFDAPENKSKGVISLNGSMVERLHLQQAQSLLAKQSIIDTRRHKGTA